MQYILSSIMDKSDLISSYMFAFTLTSFYTSFMQSKNYYHWHLRFRFHSPTTIFHNVKNLHSKAVWQNYV